VPTERARLIPPVLERLTQRLGRRSLALRQLVEEEGAVVGEAMLVAATRHLRAAARVVRVSVVVERPARAFTANAPELNDMPSFVNRAHEADEVWAETLQQLDGCVLEEVRRFRLQYVWIYRNGSRVTHPSSRIVDAFASGNPPSSRWVMRMPSDTTWP
jgi:hypothetical protein